MASRGSVIPLFINQMIVTTITDPEWLVLYDSRQCYRTGTLSLKIGKHGKIIVQRHLVKASILAQELFELYDSKSPFKKRIRHGEKKNETLVTSEEMVKASDLGNYYSIASDSRDLNYAPYFSEGNKNDVRSVEYNSDNAEHLDVVKMKDLLMQLPEIKNDPLIKI